MIGEVFRSTATCMFRIVLPLLASADYSYLRTADSTPGVEYRVRPASDTYNLIKVVAAGRICYIILLESGDLGCCGSYTNRCRTGF